MSGDDKISSRDFGDSSQLTNWTLDSESTCHMTPQVSDFIPESLYYMDKYIAVAYVQYIKANQKGQVQMIICDDNGNNFIVKLHNVSLAPNICAGLFFIILLISLVLACLFHKVFCTMYFGDKK